jgi:hypothetical protein
VDGVSPGDVVAADNFSRLSDGSKVIPRPSGGQESGQGQQGQHKGHHQQDSQ